MVTEALRAQIKNTKLLTFMRLYNFLVFDYGDTDYRIKDNKVIFKCDLIESDESVAMSMLHELGHFLAVPLGERLLRNNYGFVSSSKNGAKALEHEIQTVANSLALAYHFDITPTSYHGIIAVLRQLEFYRFLSEEQRALALGRCFLKAADIDISLLFLDFHQKVEYLERFLKIDGE